MDNLREVIWPGVPQDILEGVPPRCSSNLNSSDDVLDPVADHADVQLADWDATTINEELQLISLYRVFYIDPIRSEMYAQF